MQLPQLVSTKKRPPEAKIWGRNNSPRQKLKINGPQALTDAELLCLILGRNTLKKDVMELSRDLLRLHGQNLQDLAQRSAQDLVKLKLEGLGTAKASAIAAAFELGRRRHAGIAPQKPVFKDSNAAAVYLQTLLADTSHEVFAILYLNQANRLKHHEIISKGGIAATQVDPRLILKHALQEEAVSIIVCHNHPSGNLSPSQADKILTTRIKEGANYLDIKLLDHIIVSRDGFFSFASEGLLA
jgi:DNA repair protein RadC